MFSSSIHKVILENSQRKALLTFFYSDEEKAMEIQRKCKKGISNKNYDIVICDDSGESILVNLSHVFLVRIETEEGLLIN